MFYPNTCPAFARAYVSTDAELTDPLASPVFADYHGFPPVLFHVGSPELLVDDSRRVHEKIMASGGCSRLEIYDGVFHAWQMGVGLIPEADASLKDAAEFIKSRTADG
jgi:acetyl esterase/lipase